MKNIIETAEGNPDFSTLVAAIKKADLVKTLSETGPFTVFAPTNAAFGKIPMAVLDSIMADKEKLALILTYHVVAGKVMTEEVVQLSEATTLEGTKVHISTESDVRMTEVSTPDTSEVDISTTSDVMINDAKVTIVDLECSNGVIHVIDTVLMP
jgi:uncharacterized surface protein with fasciclin (FAS1) repeats